MVETELLTDSNRVQEMEVASIKGGVLKSVFMWSRRL